MVRAAGSSLLLFLLVGCATSGGSYKSGAEIASGTKIGEKSVAEPSLDKVESKVIEVCSRPGCWIKMEPPEALKSTGFLLGRFKNSDYVPPSSLKGKEVKLTGRYVRQRYSPATQREILTEIGLESLASQVKNRPVERMEFEIHLLEIL